MSSDNKPFGWEPCTTKPQPKCNADGAFDLTPGANTTEAYYQVFEQQLDELASYKNLKGPPAPTNREIEAGIKEWDGMLRQLTNNLRPILASKGLKLLGIDRFEGFDSKAYIADSAGRRFDVEMRVDELEQLTNGRETFTVMQELVVQRVMAAREAFHKRVEALGREIEQKRN